jgi:hypothetical protein
MDRTESQLKQLSFRQLKLQSFKPMVEASFSLFDVEMSTCGWRIFLLD